MYGVGAALGFIAMHNAEVEKRRKHREHMQATLTPEQFKEWDANETAERRHKELCRAIENAGSNARPRGSFFLGTGSFK